MFDDLSKPSVQDGWNRKLSTEPVFSKHRRQKKSLTWSIDYDRLEKSIFRFHQRIYAGFCLTPIRRKLFCCIALLFVLVRLNPRQDVPLEVLGKHLVIFVIEKRKRNLALAHA